MFQNKWLYAGAMALGVMFFAAGTAQAHKGKKSLCSEGEIPKVIGGEWACATDTDTNAQTTCSDGQVLLGDGSCAPLPTDTDTLAELECEPGDLARVDTISGEWICLSPVMLKAELGRLKLVFVTTGFYSGDLGGLEGADDACNIAAGEAGLPGSYVAWLSDSQTDAKNRLTPGSGPFYRTDGMAIANDIPDLLDSSIANPINHGQDGLPVSQSTPLETAVWTGTLENGLGWKEDPCEYCNDWDYQQDACAAHWRGDAASNGGRTTETAKFWTDAFIGKGCSQARLYCFQK